MITVLDPIKSVGSIIGLQKRVSDLVYRKSVFVLELPFSDKIILFHTLTGEMIEIDAEDYRRISFNDTIKNQLINKWFFVPEDFDEITQCQQLRNVVSLIEQKKSCVCRYTIFTTTSCNARCFYCFEKGQKQLTMSQKTALDAVEWMINHSEDEPLFLRWFGGEPLCNVRAIDTICNKLKTVKKSFSSEIVTNAFLFNEDILKRAINEWNLKRAIITLDGTENAYNRIKAYTNVSDSPYQIVIENIRKLVDCGIKVTVNLNMDASNVQDLKELADELVSRFGFNSCLNARCELLKEYVNKIHVFEDISEAYSMREMINRILEEGGIRERRYLDRKLKINSCMADDKQSLTILPDGRIGKCEHFGDSNEVGDLYEGIDPEKSVLWSQKQPDQENCRKCSCYPLCIRLKKCNAVNEKCDESLRTMMADELKQRVINTYKIIMNERA